MHPWLRGYATAVFEDAAAASELAGVARDLGQVVDVAGADPSLSAALTDVGVPAAARRAVLSDLLAARVAGSTLRVVLQAVEREPAAELLGALGELAELAHLTDERPGEVDVDAPMFGRSARRALLAGYAAATFEAVGSTAELEEVEDELFRFARIVEMSDTLRAALVERTTPLAARQQLVHDLLGGRSAAVSERLAREVLRGRVRDVVTLLDWLVELAAQARGWRVARVHAARPLDEDGRRSLAEATSRLTGMPVELQVQLDESLLAGAVVQVGDLLVDATARHRLAQIGEGLGVGGPFGESLGEDQERTGS